MRPPPGPLLHFFEEGSGPPLLLVHGLMVTGEMFSPVLPRLAAGHRVIVPDLRGHGRSRALPPPYTASRLALDLRELLDHLGIASCAVLGYSQGGAIAQQLALDHHERCSSLVLACTYAYNMASLREKLEGRLVPGLIALLGMRRFSTLVCALGLKQVPRDRAAFVSGLIADQDSDLMKTAWRESMAFDSRRRLGEIRCPTLVLAGGADTAVPLHHARMLHEGIPGSRLVVVDGADHALVWARPEALLGPVEAFLDA